VIGQRMAERGQDIAVSLSWRFTSLDIYLFREKRVAKGSWYTPNVEGIANQMLVLKGLYLTIIHRSGGE